jgi:4-hydroxy-4-methyl-2-oxoglutarate aldolase
MDFSPFQQLSPCDYADALERQQFMDSDIHGLWTHMPRIAGPAFTVSCAPGDHLMFHAAIYRAKAGDIIVAKGDMDYALAGGNVCAIAKSRGIVGFVIDGMVRDVAEIRHMQFPVFARGVIAKPGAKKRVSPLNQPIHCAGVKVNSGDIIVADEEGIAVIPLQQANAVYQIAKQRADKDASMDLTQWQVEHRQKVEQALRDLAYQEQ